jgi:hypothetical protein
MSEQAKKELFDYLVKEYAQLEAEWWTATQKGDRGAAAAAFNEQRKLKKAAEVFNINIKSLEMQGWGNSLDIITA